MNSNTPDTRLEMSLCGMKLVKWKFETCFRIEACFKAMFNYTKV